MNNFLGKVANLTVIENDRFTTIHFVILINGKLMILVHFARHVVILEKLTLSVVLVPGNVHL